MDLAALKPVLEKIGFDPALLAHAVGTAAVFRYLAMPFAKGLEVVPRRYEKLVAFGACMLLDVAGGVGLSGAKLLPAVSAAAVGAVLAMVVYDYQHKREVTPAPDPDQTPVP